MPDHGEREKVVARSFPTADVVFAERVRELLQHELQPDREAVRAQLETALRDVYPHVHATIRSDVASFGDTVIYVFRDGSIAASLMAEDWIDDASTARLVSDHSGTYLEANEQAAGLFGRTADEIVGRRLAASRGPMPVSKMPRHCGGRSNIPGGCTAWP